MAVLKPRERVVYFRLSEDEFRHFERACEQVGARSLSDLTRNAIKQLISQADERHDEHDVLLAVRNLEGLMTDLHREVKYLIDMTHMKRMAEEGSNAQGPSPHTVMGCEVE